MRTRTATGISRAHKEGRWSGLAAGLVVLVEIVRRGRFEGCGVPDSSDNATSIPRTGLDGPPTAAVGPEKF